MLHAYYIHVTHMLCFLHPCYTQLTRGLHTAYTHVTRTFHTWTYSDIHVTYMLPTYMFHMLQTCYIWTRYIHCSRYVTYVLHTCYIHLTWCMVLHVTYMSHIHATWRYMLHTSHMMLHVKSYMHHLKILHDVRPSIHPTWCMIFHDFTWC